MMTRNHVTELLSAYVDEQVSPAERSRIETHLSQCAQCRGHLESLRGSVALVRGLDPVPAPAGFQEAVRARVAETAVSPRRAVALPRLRLSWKTAGVAAAALLVGIFSVNLLREMQPRVVTLEGQRDERQMGQSAGERSAATAPKGAGPLAPSAQPAPGAGNIAPPAATIPGFRRIIRAAHVTLAVDDFDGAVRRLVAIAEGAGGFVANSSYAQTGSTPEGSFTLRVPAPRFGAVLEDIERLGTVEVRRIGGQDVTEEFVDLQARVRNLERHEQRLLSFMDHATKVSELLAIEQELARVRGEIELLTGRLRFIGNQVDLATVEVAMRQRTPKAGGFWDFGATLRRMQAAFLMTIRQILGAIEKAGVLISALAPVLLLAGLGWLIVRRVRARTV